jgi:hypothetical protein
MVKAVKAKSSPAAKGAPKAKRAPSAYNIFMKTEIAKVKSASPTLDHKDAFKTAAGNWKTSKENPANKK